MSTYYGVEFTAANSISHTSHHTVNIPHVILSHITTLSSQQPIAYHTHHIIQSIYHMWFVLGKFQWQLWNGITISQLVYWYMAGLRLDYYIMIKKQLVSSDTSPLVIHRTIFVKNKCRKTSFQERNYGSKHVPFEAMYLGALTVSRLRLSAVNSLTALLIHPCTRFTLTNYFMHINSFMISILHYFPA